MKHTGWLLCAALLVGGCARYASAPLDVAAMQREFAARSLSDKKLLTYLHLAQPPAKWDLDLLAKAAIYYHPDIAAARAHAAAMGAAEVTAGESPNPTMAISPEYSFNPADASPWVLGWTFDVPIETAGKRKKRIAVAKADTQVAEMEVAESVWTVRARVRDALAEYLFDLQAADYVKREVDAREHYIGLWDTRVKAGAAARGDADTARVDNLTARQTYFAALGQIDEARTRLAAALGMPTSGLANVELEFPSLETFSAVEANQIQWQMLANRLDVRRALLEYTSAEESLKLEIAKQYPDVHIGPGYTFDQGQNKFQLGLSMELPFFNQNQGGVAEAIGKRRELAAKFLALQAQSIGESETAQAQYAATLRELTEAIGEENELNGQVDRGTKAFDAGQEDRVFLVGIQVQQAVQQRLRLDAMRKTQAARAALEDAIQRPINLDRVQP